ncbi:MAG: DNA translocase FtsK 4TM domain-containing protein, partial [Ornithinimicrobium sp.]
MGIATVVGGTARSVSGGDQDLEREHRRDGLGLVLISLALVVALREWWGLSGPVGGAIHAVAAGTFGRVALALPVVLFVFGLRMMRAPREHVVHHRLVVATVALTMSACGLAHLASGSPDYAEGQPALQAAGGVVGFVVAA